MKRQFFLGIVLVLLSQQNVGAHYTDSSWINVIQPDGTSFIGRGWGDEFEFQWETQEGYRIVKNYPSGFWCYAALNEKGDYAPSEYIVGKHDPNAAGIPKHLLRSPECQEEIRKKREEFDRMLENIRRQRRGGGSGKSGGSSVQSVTTIQIAAILVEFKDVKHDPQYSLTDFNNMMTSAGIYTGPPPNLHPQDKPIYGSIRDYWYDMSNGQVIFTGGVWNASGGTINWVVLDYNKIDYHNNTRNLRADVLAKVQNEPTPGPNLIRAIIYAGNEYDGGGLNPSSPGLSSYEYIDSEEFNRPTGIPHEEPTDLQFFKNIGVACHELGHAAFGFPDRYGTYNTLLWDLMGIGQKSGPDNEMACPSTLNPFDRKSENWISYQSFSGTQTAKPFAYNYSSSQIFQVAVSGNEYFLIENRRNQLGSSGTFDLWLPAQGILVWHVRNSTGAGIINLIEADNTQSEANLAGDPFPGSSNNTNLNDFTTPNCKYASGNNTSMVLHYISAPAATMTADWGSKWFGNLPLNLTWSGTVISNNLTVPSGRTLTISAGTLPKFDTETNLIVNGSLQALGTSSQLITFDRNAASGTWYGIVINSSSGASSTIDYASIQHAIIAIQVNNASPSIKNSIIANNEEGIYLNYSSAYLENNTIEKNTGGLAEPNGVDIYYAIPTLRHNLISRNPGSGVYGYYWAWPEFGASSQAGNNIVALNGRGLSAVQYSNFQAGESGWWPGDNSIFENTLFDAAAYSSSVISADQNWWGTPNQCGALYEDATSEVYCNNPLSSDPNNWGIPVSPPGTLPTALGNGLTKHGSEFTTIRSISTTSVVSVTPLDSLLQLGQLRRLNRQGQFPSFIGYLQNLANAQNVTVLGRTAKGMLAVELYLAGRLPEALAIAQELQTETVGRELEKVALKTRFDVYLYGLDDSTSARNVLAELKTKYPGDLITKHARIALRDSVISSKQASRREKKSTELSASASPAAPINAFDVYPNPYSKMTAFNSLTHFRFRLSSPQVVRLAIFNVLGKEVAELLYRELAGGEHTITWNGKARDERLLPSGLYFGRLQVGAQVKVARLLVLR